MPSVSFYTLGCKLNFAETGMIGRDFAERGFQVVTFGTPSDVTVINTCTVTDEADRKCRQLIRRAIRVNPESYIIVTGCYAQLRADEIASIPGVDAVLGAAEKQRIFELIDVFAKPESTQVEVSCIDDVRSFGPAFSAGERTRAFLKIQDGCDYSCSFCTIPMARGRSRSQSMRATVGQAEQIAREGFREIVLSGVNLGLFGSDSDESLLDLLQRLDRVEGIARYRISSIEPNLLTDEIIEFVAGSRRFAPHFHLPLQSGDDFVLGKMRRRYRRDTYRERVERIRDTIPAAAIGADVIVGFPFETPDRFDATASFLSDLPVSYLHVFTYSERDGTAAVEDMRNGRVDAVPRRERSRRNRVLRMLSDRKRTSFYTQHTGTSRRVLWEGKVDDGRTLGFTDNYIRVSAPCDEVSEGGIQDVILGLVREDGTVDAGIDHSLPIELPQIVYPVVS